MANTETMNVESKSAGIAAILSFLVVGLGQIYKGQVAKGIVLFIVTFVLCITIVGVLIAIPLWIWNVFDAATGVKNGNDGKKMSLKEKMEDWTEKTNANTEALKNSDEYKAKLAKNENDFRWLVGDKIADKWMKL